MNRLQLSADNKLGKYFFYALGEIVLVVVGILIALQVNNYNESIKTREKEVVYLKNIKNDLHLTHIELDEFIKTRTKQILSANRIIEYYNGKPVTDFNAFNYDIVSIYTWQRFYLIDNTFQELVSSGNLAIISNDSIKNGLLSLDVLYKKLKYNEDHFRYDAEVTLYEPSYGMLDIDKLVKNYMHQISGGKNGEMGNLNYEYFKGMLSDKKQKNGFVFASLEFSGMISRFNEMKETCEKIIELIDNDLSE